MARLRTQSDAHIVHGAGLDPPQRVGVQFLVDARRALLADVMGAGKSPMAIRAALEAGVQRVLVITKKSLIHHWLHEIALWSGEQGAAYTTKTPAVPEERFVVTSYETVVRRLENLLAAGFEAVVADEATAVKNRKARRSKAVHRLCHAAKYAWLLTGTPVHNRPDELWSLLHALDRKTFSSYWRFVNEYCVVDLTPWGRKILGPRNLERLRLATAPYILRRDAAALGIQLPELEEETIRLEMTPRQAALYRSMEKEFFAEPLMAVLAGEPLWAPSVVAQLVRLRQIACSPELIGDTDAGCKTPALADFFEENLPYCKALVFTSFAEYADVLAREFAGYNPVLITGAASGRQRQEAVAKFSADDSCRLLIGTIRAMGEGLNLQAADIVVFTDMDWSPAAMDQAVARAWRRGRENPVRVVKLVASGTVDEHVAAVLAGKDRMIKEMDAVAFIVRQMKGGRTQ